MASDQRPRRSCVQQPQPHEQPPQQPQPQEQPHQKLNQGTELNYGVWRASAGSLVHVPKKHSMAYFFPQGYSEQAMTTVSFSPMVTSRPAIPCRVLDRIFMSDFTTDEIFVKYRLMPLPFKSGRFLVEGSGSGGNGDGEGEGEGNDEVEYYVKRLTTSDANNGGGFSVPRFCAETIFPPLDFEKDPPVQNLRINDVHGVEWPFRHIYRGTPRRHLLTSGWSKFVNSKKLISQDCVVFIKSKVNGELYVGIRRAFTPLSRLPVPGSRWDVGHIIPTKPGEFSRRQRGRVPAEAVLEETEKAVNGMPFEVVYYPRAGLHEFVVDAEKVEQSLRVYWRSEMRIKFAQDIEDGGPRSTWFNGTVDSVVHRHDHGPWPRSPWRMLEITWDEPDKLEEIRTLSPWQVECVPPFTTAKKLKSVQNSVLLADGKGEITLPPFGFNPMMMSQLSPSYMNYNHFPAGMQGARQFPSIVLSHSPTIMNGSSHQGRPDDNMDNGMSQNMEGAVSTDLNIASSSCETPSPESHNSVQLFGATPRKVVTSFQLFGKTINTEQPLADTNDVGSTEGDNAESQRSTVMKPSAL